jgi:dihydroxyacetone kinase
MKRFFNSRETIVTEALDGVLRTAGAGRLARLDGYPHIKVLLRRDFAGDRVAVLSGGGSGHEPAHAGFVGPGMLTAAIAGEIFASPSVEAVLAAILAVTGPAGCLLIVKNYTGDRLNFGLAAERAKRLGCQVEVVIVADDIAIPDAVQPRGIAGTLFVHKIAGHLAESGRSLAEVAAAARAAAEATYSLGVALSTCTIPGSGPGQRPERGLGDHELELGLGIHGEPGRERLALGTLRHLVTLMAERLDAALPGNQARYGLLLNNLGSVPPLEMSLVAHELLRTPLAERVDLLFGPAPLMTSLNMNGFSVSLIALDAARREALLAPVGVPAWPAGVAVGAVELVPLHEALRAARLSPSAHARTREVLAGLAAHLVTLEDSLNALDARVGDGDTGSTLARAARSVLGHLEELPLASPGELCLGLGELLSRSMGGSSGVLLSILFTATGSALLSGLAWGPALAQGAERVQLYGGAARGDRTLLDALLPAIDQLCAGAALETAARAAQAGADATAGFPRARAGRSSSVGEAHLAGVPDPGATAVAATFSELARLLR